MECSIKPVNFGQGGILKTITQSAIVCSKLTIETLEQGVKFEHVNANWDK